MKAILVIELWKGERSNLGSTQDPYGPDATKIGEVRKVIEIDESEFPDHDWAYLFVHREGE